MDRIILHADMNSFYASVECMEHPEWRDRPLAVCGDEELRHGIVLAKNQAAKAYGVSTGEAIWQAKAKCPDLLIRPVAFEKYFRISALARQIYGEYTDRVEPYGPDECWLDLTGCARIVSSGRLVADEIRKRIRRELGLTVSVGVSYNKIFAKFGSDYKKPDATTEITKDNYKTIVWPAPCTDLFGIGPATGAKLLRCGVRTVGRMAALPRSFMTSKFGIRGGQLWDFSHGLDASPVAPLGAVFPEKSCGAGVTATEDLHTDGEVLQLILCLADKIGHRLLTHESFCAGFSLCVRDTDLDFHLYRRLLPCPTQSASELAAAAFALFLSRYGSKKPVRALTLTVTDLLPDTSPRQTDIFSDVKASERAERLDRAADAVRSRFGDGCLVQATLLRAPKIPDFFTPSTLPSRPATATSS